MSLATRCPACGTVFRVVQDQLRVSEGWVRCGRCAEVFNAVENLVDLGLETPPVRSAGGSLHRDRVMEDLARVSGQPAPSSTPPTTPSSPPTPSFFSPLAPPSPSGSDDGGADSSAVAHSVPIAMPSSAPGLSGTPGPSALQPARGGRPGTEATGGTPAEPGSTVSPLPAAGTDLDPDPDSDLEDSRPAEPAADLRAEPPPFVRQAERAARWRTSRYRAALAVAVLIAAGALVLQVTMAYRDLIAARWSVLRPPLALLCSGVGCRIEPPRQVNALVVDSSGLVRVNLTSTYRLSVVLRNRAPIELALPAVDLTLTDARGEVIARRVLDAAELGADQRSLPGGGELSLQALLAVGDRAVSGYTIEVFYP
jgi:predicted Zn finger-like uncharacterized protein